jgi:hypothetical protein
LKRKMKDTREYVYPHAYLFSASSRALKQAEENDENSFSFSLASMVLSAFYIEAYLNFLGKEKLECWAQIEKKLGPREKLELLTETIGCSIDKDRRPFRTFTEIIKFRNKIAHAKPEVIDFDKVQLDKNGVPLPTPEWGKQCNRTTARRFFDDILEMVNELHKKAGLEGSPIGVLHTPFVYYIEESEE